MHYRALLKAHFFLRAMFLLCAFVLLITLAGPALAQAAGSTGSDRSWGAFFGRMHVVVLHLPIGLIIGAFAVESFGLFKRSKGFDVAAAWLFVLGAGTAIVASVSGLLLGTEWAAENSGDEPMSAIELLTADSIEQGVTETMGWHMWLGITLTFAAILAAAFKVLAVRKQWKAPEASVPERGGWPLAVSRLALVGSMSALPFAGHLGGNMTHGPEFLVERAPFGVPQWAVVWPEPYEGPNTPTNLGGDVPDDQLVNGTAAYWNAKIQPIMNRYCTDCHNASKQNGKLRLDTLEWAMKGGTYASSDNIIIDDFELKSEIYRRVTLPHSHQEHMPPTKKIEKYGTMTLEEKHLLGEWLLAFDGKLETGGTVATNPGQKNQLKLQPEPVKPLIDPKAVEAIAKVGGSAQSLSQADPKLAVKLAYLKDLSPDDVFELDAVAEQVAWLTFERSSLDDAGVSELPNLPALTELNLKDTEITDKGVAALPAMPKLDWLNLFGTEVTDASIDKLKSYGSLKKLYVTGTKLSEAGVGKLREALPDAQVYSDFDGTFTFPKLPEAPKPVSEKKAEQVSAKPINAKCPVSGADVKSGFVSTFEGKTIGFCCNHCKSKFDADPKKFAAKLPQ